ncbi:uncharacterized protein LOC141678320 isoform X2 [Apium graveolens]|uniref:uncharacterized protein LOC141678320 isoform X2 n=1 Tax=Apium graveolens TaxID=4045 RepID=UPI003D797456
MKENYFFLRFHHKGQFQKTKYSNGTSTTINAAVDPDRFSFSVLMEYVKDDLGYKEIGGVYAKKEDGWKLLMTDKDVDDLVAGVKLGSLLDIYLDNVVDTSIVSATQIQPHIVIRPRTHFEGADLPLKRKFVTIKDLTQQITDKIKSRALVENEIEHDKQISTRKLRKAGDGENKNVGDELVKKNATDKKLVDYELNRRRRMEANAKEADKYKLKEKANEFFTAGKSTKKAKKTVTDHWSEAEFDRAYISGHDSLSEEEAEHVIPQPKKKVKNVKKVNEVVVRPRTRSCSVNQTEGRTEVNDRDILPPPPPLPAPPPFPLDLTQLQRPPANERIGTMEAFVDLQKHKKDAEQQRRVNDDENFEGESSTKSTRRRGPTKMNHVFTRRLDERPVINLNHDLQPVSKEKNIITEFSSFIRTIARLYIPLDYVNWSKVPKAIKDGWWEYIKTKYIIPEEGKDWVIRSLADDWRVYKSRVKSACYTKFDTDAERMKNRPANIPVEQFKVLLKYWSDESVKKKAETNKKNRKNVTDTHTAGRTSFAQIRNEMKIGKDARAQDTKKAIYPKTRKGHTMMEKKNGKTPQKSTDKDEEMADLDLAAHGPNWLVGRSGITRKTKKKLTKEGKTDSSELEKATEKLAAAMEEKMQKKLRKIFEKLGELNPGLNIDVEELCAQSSAEVDENEDDYEDA